MCNAESNLNRFNCGNIESLKSGNIREALLGFHQKWYSSNIMKLCVVAKNDIETLENLVNDLFTQVENKEVEVPNLNEPKAFTEAHLQKFIKFVPIKDKDILTLMWVLPYTQREYKSKPLSYFSHLFGHEGQNSILSYLISEGLALELSSYDDHELWSMTTFYIDITLTKKGLE